MIVQQLILKKCYQINFLVCMKRESFNYSYINRLVLVEYPYEIPQPVKNRSPSPTGNPVETVTTLTKNLKLNVNKTLEGQGYLSLDKT